MFLRLRRRVYASMGDQPRLEPVILALSAIDLVDEADAGAVQITLTNGDSLVVMGTIDGLADAIDQLTEGQGLVAICPEFEEPCEPESLDIA